MSDQQIVLAREMFPRAHQIAQADRQSFDSMLKTLQMVASYTGVDHTNIQMLLTLLALIEEGVSMQMLTSVVPHMLRNGDLEQHVQFKRPVTVGLFTGAIARYLPGLAMEKEFRRESIGSGNELLLSETPTRKQLEA